MTTTTTLFKLSSARFGDIEYTEDDVVHFEDGLVGFPTMRQFLVLNPRPGGPFRWLQSIEEPALAFLVAEPFHYVTDYNPTIPAEAAERVGLKSENPHLVFVTASIPRGRPDDMTLNLAGPILVEPISRRAIQVVVEDEAYTTKYRVFQPASQTHKAA